MNQRSLGLSLIGMLAVLLMLATAYSQDEMTHIDNRSFANPQRTASVFPHDTHNESAGIEECSECHHLYEEGKKLEDESSEDQRCADCHEARAVDGRPGLRNAFHGNCKGCHAAAGKGPIMCGECHRR